jgi:hypothetical protein
LTLKATSLIIAQASLAGFIERKPLRPLADPIRRILVKPAIDDLIEGTDPSTGFPHRMADKVIGWFIAGWYMRVSRKSAEDVDLEQLEDLDDVWALCFREPTPGWRLLGRFLEQDVFVGIRLYHRTFLGRRANYHKIAGEIPSQWEAELGSLQPLRSPDLSAYLSGTMYDDVDEAKD